MDAAYFSRGSGAEENFSKKKLLEAL